MRLFGVADFVVCFVADVGATTARPRPWVFTSNRVDCANKYGSLRLAILWCLVNLLEDPDDDTDGTLMDVDASRYLCALNRGGGGKKIRANYFFLTPLPLRGYPPKKNLAPHVGIFFCQEEFLYFVLLELECHPHFATLQDIGT